MTLAERRPAIVALSGAIAALVIALAGIVFVDLIVRRIVLHDLRMSLTRTVTAAAALIDGDRYGTFTRPEQDTTEEYRRASRPLRVLVESNPDIRFAYSGVTTGTTMRFVLDGSPTETAEGSGNPEHAHPMDQDSASPGEIEVTRTHRVTVEQEPSPTAWGMGIRAQAPIFESTGNMAGYVGITMRADRYEYLIHRTDSVALLGAIIVTGLATLTGFGIWRTEQARSAAAVALRAERDRLRHYARGLDRRDHEARRATAAALHENVGQILAGQRMILGVASARAGSELRPLIDQAAGASREALREIQAMIQDISAPELEEATLAETMLWLQKLFQQRYGFTVDVAGGAGLELNGEQRQLMYRIVRELLCNALEHSGCREAQVEIGTRTGWIEVRVCDGGVGFEVRDDIAGSANSLGLAHIRERVRAAGGAFDIDASPGNGCRATVRLPLAGSAA